MLLVMLVDVRIISYFGSEKFFSTISFNQASADRSKVALKNLRIRKEYENLQREPDKLFMA